MKEYRKALVATGIAVCAALGSGLTDGHLSAAEVVSSALAGFLALGAVWGVRNGDAPPEE